VTNQPLKEFNFFMEMKLQNPSPRGGCDICTSMLQEPRITVLCIIVPIGVGRPKHIFDIRIEVAMHEAEQLWN
jgi:hypothetical protein